MAIQTQRATQSTKVVVNVGRATRRRVRRRRAPAPAAPRLPPSAPMPIREFFMASHSTPTVQGSQPVARPIEVRQPVVERPESDPFVAPRPTGELSSALKARYKALVYGEKDASPFMDPRDPSYSATKEFGEELKRLPREDPLRQRLFTGRPSLEVESGAAAGVGGHVCKTCGKEFPTIRGLRTHETRSQHKNLD